MSLLDSLPFERLLWLVPIFFALHNMEEAPLMERWSRRLPFRSPLTVTTRQFVIAVTVLTVAAFVLTYLGIGYFDKPAGYLLVLGIQTIVFFNAFIPHIAATIRLRTYSPGVITAILITIPFSFYLFRRALAENILTWSQFWVLLGIAPVAMIIFALTALGIGRVFDRRT